MEKSRHALLIVRTLTTKVANRAAVHGVKPPLPDAVDKEEVLTEIQKAIQEKEAKRKQIEETLHSHLRNHPMLDSFSAN